MGRSIDFLIIGGGPAGSGFAILAARAGASVLLVERDDYARPRAGEHLAGQVRTLLDRLGVSKPSGVGIAERSIGIVSAWPNGAPPLFKRYHTMGRLPAILVTRNRFDEWLSNAAATAGATVLRTTSAVSVERTAGGGWEVVVAGRSGTLERVRANAVVDASGRNMAFARRQGARRTTHGDLTAIAVWLTFGEGSDREAAPLVVESCPYGWWSVSTMSGVGAVATLYTSARTLKEVGVAPLELWRRAIATTGEVGEVLSRRDLQRSAWRALPAAPSLASHVVGDGWISVGDAALTLDPLGGQGVAFALETAFRAFEAAAVDPTWSTLGGAYRDALADRFDRHLAGRAKVYAQAQDVLCEQFLDGVVSGSPATPRQTRRYRT